MNIGIVTSFYNGYDRFLPRWANSIAKLKSKPDYVVMYASGSYDDFNKYEAISTLKKACINHVFIETEKHNGMGYGRNHAVRNCLTEWVMYLDVDDTILPGALSVVSKYEDMADVICTGLKIVGDKKNRVMLFDKTSRDFILGGGHGSCSHSVFKRKFWELSPWIEDNDYIEQPFWLGLAQAGASFVGTKGVCTVYHSRKDGHNLSMTKGQKEEAREQYMRFLREGVNKK